MKAASSIFEYRDYRKYLSEEYARRKASEYGFSYRSFARRAGSSGSNYLKLVTEGQRNLTPEMAHRFAEALGLDGESRTFFCDLVAFNQATTNAERERCYASLRRYRAFRRVFRLDDAHAQYHSEWYFPAIRELCATDGFQSDPAWIARKLRPRISVREAKAALKVLLELDLIKIDEEGNYAQTEILVATGDDQALGHHIVNYHRKMMERASASIDEVSREEREIGSLTLAVSPRRAAEIKQRLYEFRQELLQSSLEVNNGETQECGSTDNSDACTEVIQINFQLFPLTQNGSRS